MSATDSARERLELLESVLELAKQEKSLLIQEKAIMGVVVGVIDRDRPIMQIISLIEERLHLSAAPTKSTMAEAREVALMRASGLTWEETKGKNGERDTARFRKRGPLKDYFEDALFFAERTLVYLAERRNAGDSWADIQAETGVDKATIEAAKIFNKRRKPARPGDL